MDDETEDFDIEPATITTPSEDRNLEDAFQSLFKTSASGTGEEELLRIASTYSRQLSMRQIKALLFLEWSGNADLEQKDRVRLFIDRWLELMQFNHSDQFVMRALDSISLRKFIGENAFKINIEK